MGHIRVVLWQHRYLILNRTPSRQAQFLMGFSEGYQAQLHFSWPIDEPSQPVLQARVAHPTRTRNNS